MKRKQDHEEHMDETWLIPYADLLTLLLALFIVLFATSTVDQELLTAMKQAFYEEYTGVMPEAEVGDPGTGGAEDGGAEVMPEDVENLETPEDTPPIAETPVGTDDSPGETVNRLIEILQQEFSHYVATNELENEMRIEPQREGLLITLTSDIWFPSGSAEINASQKAVAGQIAKMIAKVQDDNQIMLSVIVSGHTDNVPISGSEFPDNWRLSVTRAVNFMEVLMNNSTLQPSNFSARGFGEYEPVSSNDTEEGRQRNRRVEVLISPQVPAE